MTSRRAFIQSLGLTGGAVAAASVSSVAMAALPELILKEDPNTAPPHLPRGVTGAGRPYNPVVTLNGWTLPWRMNKGVKEFHLVAEPVVREIAPGMNAHLWGYNGQSPGPTIEVVEGDRVREQEATACAEACDVAVAPLPDDRWLDGAILRLGEGGDEERDRRHELALTTLIRVGLVAASEDVVDAQQHLIDEAVGGDHRIRRVEVSGAARLSVHFRHHVPQRAPHSAPFTAAARACAGDKCASWRFRRSFAVAGLERAQGRQQSAELGAVQKQGPPPGSAPKGRRQSTTAGRGQSKHRMRMRMRNRHPEVRQVEASAPVRVRSQQE